MSGGFTVIVTATARRAIERELPEKVATAVLEFIYGPLAETPFRLGKPLRDDLREKWCARRGEYRVIYSINSQRITITVIAIDHRREVYRSH